MKILLFLLFSCLSVTGFNQSTSPGIATGNVMDEKQKPLEGATVSLAPLQDSIQKKVALSDKNGSFTFSAVATGCYKLSVSFAGFRPLAIDSIHFRDDRADVNFTDIVLKAGSSQDLTEVIIYAEKPLIESKDGNITFNAAESALSAGSTASELLNNVPLITKDPTGKLLVRGKEPKILIDDKPVELNQQQLQDLLESLPGSSIEKIEVMTNPPPQYASEQGGVINITTRKGKVGKSGRINVSGGTRGEGSTNGNYNFRKKGFVINVNAGVGYNELIGNSFSQRQNFYGDSVRLNTKTNTVNGALRPNLRINADYDIDKWNTLNLTLSYNQNVFDNSNTTGYSRVNRFDSLYGLSERLVNSNGYTYNPNVSVAYTHKTKRAGETLKFITSINFSNNNNARDFHEQFFYSDYTLTGRDSAQRIYNDNKTTGSNYRINYDRGLRNKKTFLSTGGHYNTSWSAIDADASYKSRVNGKWFPLQALTNSFSFYQHLINLRASLKQMVGKDLSVTAGLATEKTTIGFNLAGAMATARNAYWNYLPFATVNRNWKDVLNLTISYRRAVRRPGTGELNPIKDVSDSTNIRSGNPGLRPTLTDNFDLVLGKTKKSFFINVGFGYNNIADIFSAIRITPTEITWQNISAKKEYEVSTWSGYTISKRTKLNWSASYTHNRYATYDKVVRRFRDGGSLSSSLNTNYTWKDIYNATGSFTYNRFANPQGTVRSNLSMNLGLQAKVLAKKMTLTMNLIDPLRGQQNKTVTYGSNFIFESFSASQTRNLRLTVGYNFTNGGLKKGGKVPVEKKKKLQQLSHKK